jgi:phospholipase/carboxylesterase
MSAVVDDWGGLEVVSASDMGDDQPGGAAVVLLHGWGAPGDDLVALAEVLAVPRTRFFFPAGPLPERGGGRAWWHLDGPDRPAHAWDDQLRTEPPHPQLLAVRGAIQRILRTIQVRHRPDTLVIGGFSQGAMLALDVALAAAPAVDKVAMLSGVLLADSLPALRAPGPRPAAFISHGRQDGILSFEGGDRCRQILAAHQVAVTWRPFDGGHEIPPEIVEELRAFLFPP